MTLFDADADADGAGGSSGDGRLVVRVLPDRSGLDKTFDYVVPDEWRDDVAVGTRVRVALGPRRVGAWVVEVGVVPPPGVELKPVAKITGHGPSADVIDLARWATWRWAARSPVPFLRSASPERVVRSIPARAERRHPVPESDDEAVRRAFAAASGVLRLPPVADVIPVIQQAASAGDPLVICTSRAQVERVAARLQRAGVPAVRHHDGWDRAAGGGVAVVGTRSAVWSTMPDLAAIVVLDEHDEVHQEEGSPTWHARDVALERAARAGIPCVLTSPKPSLEALSAAELVTVDRGRERDGWPLVVVADRRDEDRARNALFSPALARAVRAGGRVVCVLNHKGRAALLACGACGELARCDRCTAAMQRPDGDRLVCGRCGHTRPLVCAACGSTRVRTVRMGVSRVRSDLEALAGEPVLEVVGETAHDQVLDARLLVGTEAVLHRVEQADVVAFLDFDQELFAPRYRAAEQALALLVRGARLVGPRRDGGQLLVQTRSPEHEVLRAAVLGDPAELIDAERERRREFGFPPFRALAEIGGQAAEAFVQRLRAVTEVDAGSDGVQIQGPVDGRWRVSAPDHTQLCDALAAVERPAGRLRLAVDPPRI